MKSSLVDIVVIGGGIVGSAILHKLSAFQLKTVLIEKQPDLCEGTSKANSAIIHTGFDAPPNTIEADCLARSRNLWPELIKNHHLSYEPRGAVMVALNEEDKKTIEHKYTKNASLNGVQVKWISKEEILKRNPAVTIDCIGGLLIEDEAIIDPFEAVYTFAEAAVINGAEVVLGNGVKEIHRAKEGFQVVLEDESEIFTRYIVNAAGLYADEIAGMISDYSFTITPRKGQFIITKSKVNISNIILPVPSKISKGKLITPAVFGGHLLGPTAEDQEDKEDKSTTKAGMEEILSSCEKLIPESHEYTTVRQYAGLRTVCNENDYVIRPSESCSRMIHAAGIRSTGLSASPGIAERVAEELAAVGADLKEKNDWIAELPDSYAPENVSEEIVCLCRFVTKKDIANALNRPIVPKTLDGIKRRTGAFLGGCQGNRCMLKIADLIKEKNNSEELPLKGCIDTKIGFKKGDKSYVH